MRAVVLLALAFAAIGAAQAQQPAPAFYDQVVNACIIETSRRNTHTADQPTVAAYCQCTMSAAREEFTPAQFEMLGRYGISRTSNAPAPTIEEQRALEGADFTARAQALQARVTRDCNPVLFGPRS